MNEHSFIKAIHKKLPSQIIKWKIHDTFTGGVPDAMYAGASGLLFVEYKYLNALPTKSTTAVRTSLSKLQCMWLEHLNVSAAAALIVGSPCNILIKTSDFSKRVTKSEFMEKPVTRADVITYILSKVV